jgi:hypothetical protein
MLKLDDMILLNQLAQGIVSGSQGDAWFQSRDVGEQRSVLRGLGALILQASPRPEDAASAISASGLRPTLTPCVLIAKPGFQVQMTKVLHLPEPGGCRSNRGGEASVRAARQVPAIMLGDTLLCERSRCSRCRRQAR